MDHSSSGIQRKKQGRADRVELHEHGSDAGVGESDGMGWGGSLTKIVLTGCVFDTCCLLLEEGRMPPTLGHERTGKEADIV